MAFLSLAVQNTKNPNMLCPKNKTEEEERLSDKAFIRRVLQRWDIEVVQKIPFLMKDSVVVSMHSSLYQPETSSINECCKVVRSSDLEPHTQKASPMPVCRIHQCHFSL